MYLLTCNIFHKNSPQLKKNYNFATEYGNWRFVSMFFCWMAGFALAPDRMSRNCFKSRSTVQETDVIISWVIVWWRRLLSLSEAFNSPNASPGHLLTVCNRLYLTKERAKEPTTWWKSCWELLQEVSRIHHNNQQCWFSNYCWMKARNGINQNVQDISHNWYCPTRLSRTGTLRHVLWN